MRSDAIAWPDITRQAVVEHGQSYEVAIQLALQDGRITQTEATRQRMRITG